MNRLHDFIKTSLIGGFVVVLPVALLLLVFGWIFRTISSLIEPITRIVAANSSVVGIFADIVVLAIIIAACFFIGMSVKTRFGEFIHEKLEKHVLKIAPGYTIIKETVLQFIGRKQSPFSRVVLVRLYGNDTLATAFLVDECGDYVTVFIPTGPNPTSGMIYHVLRSQVALVDAGIEETMRTIISCGSGSAKILARFSASQK